MGFLKEFGDFRLDTARKALWHRRKAVAMPLKELELLCLLIENPGKLVTKDELLNRLWTDSFVEESNISRHIYLLRKTLRDFEAEQNLIENVPRRGYRFTGAVREIEGDELIIERHAVTETLIEITDAADGGAGSIAFSRRAFALILVLSLSSVLLGGFAFWKSRNPSGSGDRIRSLAVLPFKSIDSAPEDMHRGLGLADVLITRLSGIRNLSVRPTSAVIAYEDQQADAIEIGRRLQTDAVLEGAIYRSGSQIRVTMRLLQTSDGKPLWTGQFEKPIQDEITIQSEVALEVSDALALNLNGNERRALARPLTEDLDALTLYQKGRFEWNKRNFQGAVEAERLFRNAIEKDPEFALAYVGLADSIAMRPDALEAYNAVEKALEIDPNLGEAHATRGFLTMFQQWNWPEAERELKKAIDLDPGYANAHHWYAVLLEIEGRNEEARLEFEEALKIDPVSYNYLADLGQAYYFDRDYDKAKAYCQKALELYPEFVFAHDHLFGIYLQTGNTDAAVEEFLASARIGVAVSNPSADEMSRRENYAIEERKLYQSRGIKAVFARTLEDAEKPRASHYLPALICAYSGDKERALDHLEKALESRELFSMPFVKADPIFDRLRDQPRYKEILRKMNL